MKIIILFIITILVTACSPQEDFTQIKPDQLYLGYPCFDNCPEFQKGYQQAISQEVTTLEECDQFEKDQVSGCRAYAQEYIFLTNPEADLRISQPK